MASPTERTTAPPRQAEPGNPSTQVPEPIAEQDFDDHDSAIDSASVYTDTTSLASSVTKYRTENGRRYHAYGSTEHWGPNDESAQDQQDLSHHLWTLTLNGGLYLAPISHLQNVLDLGTGTGIWAIDMADAYPAAAVKGIDVSPIQPSWVPTNLKFEIDDYNLEWLDEGKYDLIHARELLGSVPDWVEMYKKIYSGLQPGGWVDQAEPALFLGTDYDTMGDDHVYHKWGQLMVDAGKKSGMAFDIGPHLKGWMEEAGFINVTEVRVAWPIGRWAKDPRQREIGMFNQARLDQGITDFCSRRFANNLGWEKEEIDIFGIQMRSAINNSRLLGHQWAYFVYGQKPL